MARPTATQTPTPLLQVHRFNADIFIMRENKCYSAEGNFMCLLLALPVGVEHALPTAKCLTGWRRSPLRRMRTACQPS
jgi:hypothetical protein